MHLFYTMKNHWKFFTIILLTLVYGLTINIGVYSGFFIPSSSPTKTDQQEYYASITKNISCHTPQTEQSVQNYKNFPAQNVKIQHNLFCAIFLMIDHLFETKLGASFQFERTFLIQRFNALILYPFHYFF